MWSMQVMLNRNAIMLKQALKAYKFKLFLRSRRCNAQAEQAVLNKENASDYTPKILIKLLCPTRPYLKSIEPTYHL